ncbi:unnamed protein product [Closterium sp. NIES-54]
MRGGEDPTVSRTEPPDTGGRWRNGQRPGPRRGQPVGPGQVEDRNTRPKQLWPVGAVDLVTKLSTPSIVETGEAAVLRVRLPACLTKGSSHYPQTPHAETTTHEASGVKGFRSDAAAAAAGLLLNLLAELQSYRHHFRCCPYRHSHRCLHRHSHRCLHRRHQRPHSLHHSHRCHHLHCRHHLYCCPHHHPHCHCHHFCHPCPCRCSASH